MERFFNKIIPATVVLCSVLSVLSCSKTSLKSVWSTQEDKIDSFINSLPKEEDKEKPDALYVKDVIRNKGANRVILQEGTGEGLEKGGRVTFYYAGYVFSGSLTASNMFATNNAAQAEAAGWEVNDGDYSAKTVTLDSKSGLVEGLAKGLEGVRKGEICYILFSGEYGFGKKPFGVIPGNSALGYQIWVEDVF